MIFIAEFRKFTGKNFFSLFSVLILTDFGRKNQLYPLDIAGTPYLSQDVSLIFRYAR